LFANKKLLRVAVVHKSKSISNVLVASCLSYGWREFSKFDVV